MMKVVCLLCAAIVAFAACSSSNPTISNDGNGGGDGLIIGDKDKMVDKDVVISGDQDTVTTNEGTVTEKDQPGADDGQVAVDADEVSTDTAGGSDTLINDEAGSDELLADTAEQQDSDSLIVTDELITDAVTSDGEVPDVDNMLCTPKQTVPCYTGPNGTVNVGICKPGISTCADNGMSWSACAGDVIPAFEACGDSLDNDCNGVADQNCVCTPGNSDTCYDGPNGTAGVGICKTGQKVCNETGTGYGACQGQTLPAVEQCGNAIDEDCNGSTSGGVDKDEDADGYGTCAGDCCDNTSQCLNPKVVNPGAVEVQGDNIDNNCNGTKDEDPRENCSTGTKFVGTNALDLLKGMDICKVASAGSWGIVGTPTLTLASGSGGVDNRQISLMEQFGTHASNVRLYGGNMTVLSSGHARDANDPDATTAISYNYNSGNPPADFVNPHGGELPETKAGCENGTGANDSVMLSVQLKVPTNANSFSFNFRFFSQEYESYTCSQFNDFFIAMLYSGASGIPADKNISFDANKNYISVNSNAFFTVCSPKSGYTCPDGTAPLNGTGYGYLDWEEGCDDASNWGGGTKWLTTTAPVKPGETITLKFVIWDTGDQNYDSLVLLDNFKWSAEGTSGPVTFECWDLNKNGSCDAASEDKSGDGQCTERDC